MRTLRREATFRGQRAFTLVCCLALTFFLSEATSFAGGKTWIMYDLPSTITIPVSAKCVLSQTQQEMVDNCYTDQVPRLVPRIKHEDPPSAILRECDNVTRGEVIGIAALPGQAGYNRFVLNRRLCSFGPSNYTWKTDPISQYDAGRVIRARVMHDACGKENLPKSFAFRFAVKLFNDHAIALTENDQPSIAKNKYTNIIEVDHSLESSDIDTISINLVCPKCDPIALESWPQSSSAGIAGENWESSQNYAKGGWPPFTYSAKGLPDGMSIDPKTGKVAGRLAPGVFSFAVSAQDGCPSGRQTISKLQTVVGNCAPLMISSEIPNPKSGTRYSFNLKSLKHTGQVPVKFKLVSGALPPGLLLDEITGVISGNPPISYLSPSNPAKPYSFVLRLTDSCFSGPRSIDKSFSIYVEQQLLSVGHDMKPDLALEDLAMNEECGLVATYSYRGARSISATVRQQVIVIRQQVVVSGRVLFDGPFTLEIGKDPVKKTIARKSPVSGSVEVTVAVDVDNKLEDANRANNSLTKKLSCDGSGKSIAPPPPSPSSSSPRPAPLLPPR